MILCALTIFTSSCLLFLLQLITAKQILPWFGGSSAVWITCLVFFQVGLLFGYIYSDWSSRRLTVKQQVILHGILLVLSLMMLPLIPDMSWKPTGTENPAWRIFGLLGVTIGLPYFLLSTTNPLIQAWFVRIYPNKCPYRLYALSNFASLLALLGYPLFIEPWLSTTWQIRSWAILYNAFAVLCCAVAWFSLRAMGSGQRSAPVQPEQSLVVELAPTYGTYWLWVTLAAMGSVFLLVVTNHLSQNVVAIPLLWVLPLSIYLLTYILCFEGHGWYRRNLFLGLLMIFLCAMAWSLTRMNLAFDLKFQFSLLLAGLFVACMFCHGELNRVRPVPQYLTRFYLTIALGGAIGALLVGVIAPLVFSDYYEFEIGLVGLAALALFQVRKRKLRVLIVVTSALLFTLGSLIYKVSLLAEFSVLTTRNFYGVLRVYEYPQPNVNLTQRMLMHGLTAHGNQYPYGSKRHTPTTYYRPISGIGRAVQGFQQPGTRVGIIGLGVGTMAAYGKLGDTYRFYEINPEVIQIAQQEFTYLKDSAAKIEIVLGDARLSLESEPNQQFDVLVVDAFSGDAIPLHLLTSEAIALYLQHLKPGGVIAFHLTNAYLDLAPVVQQLADAYKIHVAHIQESESSGRFVSNWALLTHDQEFLDSPYIREATSAIQTRAGDRLWTDDFNNLLQVLK